MLQASLPEIVQYVPYDLPLKVFNASKGSTFIFYSMREINISLEIECCVKDVFA